MDLEQKRADLIAEATRIINTVKEAARPMADDERSRLSDIRTDVERVAGQIEQARKDAELFRQFDAFGAPSEDNVDVGSPQDVANSLGEHFAKHATKEGLARLKAQRGSLLTMPEWRPQQVKLNTDVNTTPGVFGVPVLTQVDMYMRRALRRESVVDLFGSGSLGRGTNAVSYFIEGGAEGNFATVAEGDQKPQLHFTDPTMTTDAVRKIAGWWDTSDEMIEDLDFWVSEINNRGLYLLSMVEESQVLNGDGLGTNLLGVFNRSGIQTVVQGAAPDSAPDAIFRAITSVQTATGLAADGLVINPADYQALRLSRDTNGQYYGGGFFGGQYGQGGIMVNPPVWGLRTIVSGAVPAKTFAVGAFNVAATVYRKGGVRVESTNSDLGKFTKDIVTTRIEERLALAVRMPAAIVKGTLL